MATTWPFPRKMELLREAEDRVEEQDDCDHDRVLPIPDETGEDRRPDEDQDQQVPELVDEEPPARAWRRLRQPVRTVAGQALGRSSGEAMAVAHRGWGGRHSRSLVGWRRSLPP